MHVDNRHQCSAVRANAFRAIAQRFDSRQLRRQRVSTGAIRQCTALQHATRELKPSSTYMKSNAHTAGLHTANTAGPLRGTNGNNTFELRAVDGYRLQHGAVIYHKAITNLLGEYGCVDGDACIDMSIYRYVALQCITLHGTTRHGIPSRYISLRSISIEPTAVTYTYNNIGEHTGDCAATPACPRRHAASPTRLATLSTQRAQH